MSYITRGWRAKAPSLQCHNREQYMYVHVCDLGAGQEGACNYYYKGELDRLGMRVR